MTTINGHHVEHIADEELVELHDRVCFCARMAGLSGYALDVATARAFRAVVQLVERERQLDDKRRTKLRVVE